jgi:imidazolonepropionase
MDAGGGLVLPGLVDCHTHPIFGGDRSRDFAARINGESYQDIAARGGGIKSTIRMTRSASSAELEERTRAHFQNFASWGVTTLEAKSGYGQSLSEELRLLRILQKIKASGPQTIQVTLLALHDLPSDEADKAQFIRVMRDELLPLVAAEKLADWVDAFVEEGYFSVGECQSYFEHAKALGLGIRLHADEFAPSSAAEAAAALGAASADHLQKASDAGLRAMAAAGTVAVLLPGTSLYTQILYTSAARVRQAGCAIAVASDFNPGSCNLPNLPLSAGLAALYSGLSVAEALAAVTWNAARALRLEAKKGALAPTYDADFLIHSLPTIDAWIADFGQTKASKVFVAGVPIYGLASS